MSFHSSNTRGIRLFKRGDLRDGDRDQSVLVGAVVNGIALAGDMQKFRVVHRINTAIRHPDVKPIKRLRFQIRGDVSAINHDSRHNTQMFRKIMD